MHKRMLVCSIAVLFLFTGCKREDEQAKLKAQAEQIVSTWMPKIQGLTTKLDGLKGRVAMLPSSAPGVDALKSSLGTYEGEVKGLMTKLEGLTSAVTASDGKPVVMGKVVTDTETGISTAFTNLSQSIDNAEKQVNDLEGMAKEMPEREVGYEPEAGYSMMLPTGFELKGSAMGIESQLVDFIQDPTRELDDKAWFNFDRLSFQTGSAQLDMARSQDQLNNIVEMLKAFPSTNLKIGGYTDSTGDPAANKKLSAERATNVMDAIIAAGIDPKRLEAEGYGAEHPVCPANDTEDCKAQNRRIAVRVTKK